MHVMEGKYKGRYRAFYLNRAIRIWPLYWLVLGASACVLAAGLLLSSKALEPVSLWLSVEPLLPHPWMVGWALSQVFCVGQELSAFANLAAHGTIAWGCPGAGSSNLFFLNILPQAWTLAIEEYFYAFAPLLRRLGQGWIGALFFAGLIASSVDLGCQSLPTGFYPTTLPFFLGGIFSYRIYAAAAKGGLNRWVSWQPAIAFLLYVLAAPYLPFSAPRALTVGLAALALPSMFMLFKDLAWDRYLGDLSFPLYLVHVPVLWVLQLYFPAFCGLHPVGYAAVPLSILVSVVAAHAVERPLRRYRDRLVLSPGAAVGAI